MAQPNFEIQNFELCQTNNDNFCKDLFKSFENTDFSTF